MQCSETLLCLSALCQVYTQACAQDANLHVDQAPGHPVIIALTASCSFESAPQIQITVLGIELPSELPNSTDSVVAKANARSLKDR